MKKLFIILLAAMLLAGCGTTTDTPDITPPTSVQTGPDEKKSPETEGSAETEAIPETDKETETKASEPETIAETVLMDESGVKITAKSLDKSGWFGPELKLLIENNTDQALTVQARSSSVNGYMISTMFSADVSAGKKANDSITFTSSDLKSAGIETIADMEFSFHIFDSESWDTYLDTDLIQIKTAAAETYPYTYDDSGNVIYNADNIKVVAKGLVENDSLFGLSVMLYVYNGTDKAITIQTRDDSVNGFMVSTSCSIEVTPGKHAIGSVTFFSSDLEENEITQIADYEFSLHIFDSASWETINDSEPITLNFN